MSREDSRGVRLWPVLAVFGLVGAALLLIWAPETNHRQSQVVNTLAVSLGGLLLLLLWLLLFSRIRWGPRLLLVALVLALGVGARWAVKVRGVSGDIVPILDWRWAPEPGADSTAPGGAAVESRTSADAETLAAFAYPQFLGRERDGRASGVRLARDWQRQPPRSLWRRTVGAGWSSFAVANGLAVTHEQRGDREMVVAYDLLSGEPRWSHADEVRWEDPIGRAGPRATPTIDEGVVFAIGGTGVLTALELETGRRLWRRDVMLDNEATPPPYGVAASPLVLGGQVVVQAGGVGGRSLVAYDRASGRPLWAGGNDGPSYSSPFLTTLAGVTQIVLLTGRRIVGHDPSDGELLWSFDWPGPTEMVSKPVPIDGDLLFASTGYGIGGKLLRLVATDEKGGLAPELVWEALSIKAKFTNVVHRDGTLYGLDDGILAAAAVDTGERLWKGGRYGHGQTILAGDLLLIQAEDGDVVLVEATPEAHRELARLPAINGKTWNAPALAGPYLVVRNDEEAACYRLPTVD